VGAQVLDRPNSLNLPVFKTSDAIDRMEQTISAYNNQLDGRVRAWAMPFSVALASPELLLAARKLADKHQTGLTLHHNNSATFIEACLQQYGQRPTQYLESLGVLGPNVTLAHCLGIDQSEVDCLARTGSRVVMCPTAAVKGGVGMTRSGLLPEMLMQGVTVGLGTDAGNNSNLLESMRSMYLASVLYKDGRQDVKVVPAESALEMATIGGAAALGLADDIGSIEVGKKADLVLFDTRRPEWRALFNPVNSLVYNADGRSVHTVIIDGKVVVEGHQPLFVDEWELIQKVQAIGEGLLSRTGVSYPIRWPVV
jgi:cytosine/adenosine deaminase-related metal-dependent hydrolase